MRPGLKPPAGVRWSVGQMWGNGWNSPDGSDSSRFLSHIYPSAQPSALTGAHGSAAGSGARAGVAGVAGLRRLRIAWGILEDLEHFSDVDTQ
jgi:hypothetical protein